MGRLLFLLLWAGLLYLLWRLLFPKSPRKGPEENRNGIIDTMVQDPACGIFIPKSTAIRKKVGGTEHHFCSKACLRKYRQKSNS